MTRTKTKGLSGFLKQARIEKSITQFDAAKALGHATPQYISNFERGLCEPSLDMAIKLCELYEVPKEKLFKVMMSIYEETLREKMFTKSRKSKR